MSSRISFLLGSGFSIPEHLPSVTMLNQRLSKIDESEIMIHTDQQAFFLKGQIDNNRHMNTDERLFLQDFLKFYDSEILKEGETFHYETFYDFYSDYLYRNGNNDEIERFYQGFVEKYTLNNYKNCLNCIADFNRTFNQLIAGELHKHDYFQEIIFEYYPLYNDLISFISELSDNNKVKIHTLNHDLFFDFLGQNDNRIAGKFSDGYSLAGSPFYGKIAFNYCAEGLQTLHKNYFVKLPKFSGDFSSPISLYKLHGSIMTHTVYTDNKPERIKSSYGVDGFFIEQLADANNPKAFFSSLHYEIEPDFLSGTTHKITRYSEDGHYANLFQRFKENLRQSKALIVIGYGFQDDGINNILVNEFLSKGNKFIVIDPYKPRTTLIEDYDGIYIGKSIVDVSLEELQNLNVTK